MNLIDSLLLSAMLYAGIDDLFNMSIDEITWVIIHILVFICNWKTIIILPMYFIIKRFKWIGLADWIILAASISISNNYILLIIITYIFTIATVDIKSRKSPMILALTLATMISM